MIILKNYNLYLTDPAEYAYREKSDNIFQQQNSSLQYLCRSNISKMGMQPHRGVPTYYLANLGNHYSIEFFEVNTKLPEMAVLATEDFAAGKMLPPVGLNLVLYWENNAYMY